MSRSKKFQNFPNLMELIYARWKEWTFIFITLVADWKNDSSFLNKVYFRRGWKILKKELDLQFSNAIGWNDFSFLSKF
jgi:hypothetical protein